MRYSVEPKNRIYVISYGFLSFAKNIGKNVSNKYSILSNKNVLIVLKRSLTNTTKTASSRAFQKTSEATGDLISKNIADKTTKASKKEIYVSRKKATSY